MLIDHGPPEPRNPFIYLHTYTSSSYMTVVRLGLQNDTVPMRYQDSIKTGTPTEISNIAFFAPDSVFLYNHTA